MMRRQGMRKALGAGAAMMVTAMLSSCSAPLPPSDTASVAADAYVFGAPLVTTVRTMQAVAQATAANQLTWQTELAGSDARLVAAPSRDTLAGFAPLDLRSGPFVLTVPSMTDRYYSFQFLDAYMENDAYVSTRTTGGQAGTYFIAPPGYVGSVPDGMVRLGMRTLQVFLIGRIAVRGSDDVAVVAQYRERITLNPAPGNAGAPTPTPAAFGAPRGAPQALAVSGLEFFDELGAAMAINPPTSGKAKRIAARMAKVKLGPGYATANQNPKRREAYLAGLARGAARIASAASAAEITNSWRINPHVGRYNDDFLLRAVVSRIGWGADAPEEGVYAVTRVDAGGQLLDGARSYTITFPPNATPPAAAFWSIAAYDTDRFFPANSYDRYSVSSTEKLGVNPDGSLTLTFSRTPPAVMSSNWVPVPEGEFVLMLRVYLPMPAAADGSYQPPAIRVG